MAINFTDFSRAPIQESPEANLFENVLKGYKIEEEPKIMKQAAEQKALANSLQKLALEHKPKEYALADSLKEARIAKARQPAGTGANLKGSLATAFQLRNNLNPDDPNFEKDLAAINGYITNIATHGGAVPLAGQGAGGEAQGVKIDLPEGKAGYVPGLGKLKPGWQPVKNAEGHDIGVNVPMSDKQVDQWKAKEKFDVIYPFINTSLGEYSGRGSWDKFVSDVHNYKKDPEAKARIDNFGAANKLISIASTTENARIGGHATNVQLDELKKTLKSSEVAQKLEKAGGFALPAKYAKNAGNIFKGYLDKVESTAKTNIPAYEFRALNPGSNASGGAKSHVGKTYNLATKGWE